MTKKKQPMALYRYRQKPTYTEEKKNKDWESTRKGDEIKSPALDIFSFVLSSTMRAGNVVWVLCVNESCARYTSRNHSELDAWLVLLLKVISFSCTCFLFFFLSFFSF